MKDSEVFLWIILDEGKSRVLLNPKISLLKLDDGESSFKWCEWVELVFDEDLEGKLNDDNDDGSSLGWVVDLKEE